MTGRPAIRCLGLPASLAAAVTDAAAAAWLGLGLDADLSSLEIVADDLESADGAWFSLARPAGAQERPHLTLYCAERAFAAVIAAGVMPPTAVWEQGTPPPAPESVFDAERAAVFLHHHLMTARDLVRGDLHPADLPAGVVESFGELWSVVVDGRLERAGLPGHTMAERRRRFGDHFAPAGVLLPGHWAVFQSLWDGALPTQREVVGLIARLPRHSPR